MLTTPSKEEEYANITSIVDTFEYKRVYRGNERRVFFFSVRKKGLPSLECVRVLIKGDVYGQLKNTLRFSCIYMYAERHVQIARQFGIVGYKYTYISGEGGGVRSIYRKDGDGAVDEF